MPVEHAAIIGAGIAGLTAALALVDGREGRHDSIVDVARPTGDRRLRAAAAGAGDAHGLPRLLAAPDRACAVLADPHGAPVADGAARRQPPNSRI